VHVYNKKILVITIDSIPTVKVILFRILTDFRKAFRRARRQDKTVSSYVSTSHPRESAQHDMVTMKVALVTASSAGLGAEIAKHLVADMRVVINYFSTPDRANAVLAELSRIASSSGSIAADDKISQDSDDPKSIPRVHAIRADLGQRSEIQQLVSEAISVMGRLDIVVSNGGWTNIRNFADLEDNVEEEDWDRCFNVNVKSHLYLLHAAKDHLDATEGSFITVASVAGVKPSGSSLVYYQRCPVIPRLMSLFDNPSVVSQ
jgi:NADP-dependent 3-hydroxy acid dehydrogenase YdfG